MNAENKKGKKPANATQSTLYHPVQQIIKIGIAGVLVILSSIMLLVEQDAWKEVVEKVMATMLSNLPTVIEKAVIFLPWILFLIIVAEGLIAIIALKKNSYDSDVVCQRICIFFAVVFVLLISASEMFIVYFVISAFSRLDVIIENPMAIKLTDILTMVVPALLFQIGSFGFPLIIHVQKAELKGWANVSTWLLFTVPGIGLAFVLIYFIASRIDTNLGDGGTTYDVYIVER